ncbi:MAG TPA: hypothetical protein GX507_02775 [Clostridia bacterium]|nr:hypothetical protein [Clostridia bacterium]
MFRVIKGEQIKSDTHQVVKLPVPSGGSESQASLPFRGDHRTIADTDMNKVQGTYPALTSMESSDTDAQLAETAVSLDPSVRGPGAAVFMPDNECGGIGALSRAAVGGTGVKTTTAGASAELEKEGIDNDPAGSGVAMQSVIIDLAVRQAEKILDEAGQKASSIEKEAWGRGFEAGFKEGMAKSLEESEGLLNQAKEILEDAKAKAGRMLEESKRDLIDLVITVASRIIRDEVNLRPDVIMRLLDEAVERLDGQGVRSLRANPRDVVALEENLGRLEKRWPGVAGAKVIPDKSVEAGGMIIEGDLGTLDCTIDSQLARMRSKLLESLDTTLADLRKGVSSEDLGLCSTGMDSRERAVQGLTAK